MLAENQQETWSRMKMDAGWKWGPKKNAAQKQHNLLQPFDMLADDNKLNLLSGVEERLRVIVALGYRFVRGKGVASGRARSTEPIAAAAGRASTASLGVGASTVAVAATPVRSTVPSLGASPGTGGDSLSAVLLPLPLTAPGTLPPITLDVGRKRGVGGGGGRKARGPSKLGREVVVQRVDTTRQNTDSDDAAVAVSAVDDTSTGAAMDGMAADGDGGADADGDAARVVNDLSELGMVTPPRLAPNNDDGNSGAAVTDTASRSHSQRHDGTSMDASSSQRGLHRLAPTPSVMTMMGTPAAGTWALPLHVTLAGVPVTAVRGVVGDSPATEMLSDRTQDSAPRSAGAADSGGVGDGAGAGVLSAVAGPGEASRGDAVTVQRPPPLLLSSPSSPAVGSMFSSPSSQRVRAAASPAASSPRSPTLRYIPVPLDVTDVRLPASMELLVCLLARNLHELWAINQKARGVMYAPKAATTGRPTSTKLVPFQVRCDLQA
jgi:hypothetical protein